MNLVTDRRRSKETMKTYSRSPNLARIKTISGGCGSWRVALELLKYKKVGTSCKDKVRNFKSQPACCRTSEHPDAVRTSRKRTGCRNRQTLSPSPSIKTNAEKKKRS
ncbi:hypothetical protein Hamer_G001337 [Homarus americanus]|uniref:Uncharacterized protein n=1 Tax=Homarus americanus TaxID=6706 RepID=A0A8J5N8U2_HOMAM|nr:hypothetical protein Hamer_G001337 [Homarus americanus]